MSPPTQKMEFVEVAQVVEAVGVYAEIIRGAGG